MLSPINYIRKIFTGNIVKNYTIQDNRKVKITFDKDGRVVKWFREGYFNPSYAVIKYPQKEGMQLRESLIYDRDRIIRRTITTPSNFVTGQIKGLTDTSLNTLTGDIITRSDVFSEPIKSNARDYGGIKKIVEEMTKSFK